jgi:hypothetical protein
MEVPVFSGSLWYIALTIMKTAKTNVWTDATAQSCSKRLQLYLPDKAEALQTQRVRFLK